MLEITKLRKQLAGKRAHLSLLFRREDADRASWCREDIAILVKREAVLAIENDERLRKNNARYQRNDYRKRRAEYLASPQCYEDNTAAWNCALERKAKREAQHGAQMMQRAARRSERKARIAAMSPDERTAFFRSERSKNAAFHLSRAQSKAHLEQQRVKFAQARRARQAETRERDAVLREHCIRQYESNKISAESPVSSSSSPVPVVNESVSVTNP